MEIRYPNTGILFNTDKSAFSSTPLLSVLFCALFSILLSMLLSVCSTQVHAEIPAYSATYKAKYKGFKVRANRELKHLGNGNIQVSQSLSHFLMKIKESSEMSPSKSASKIQLQPAQYSYSRKGVGKNKNTDITFNTQQKTLKETSNKKVFSRSELPAGIQDKLSYQLQLRLDAMHYGEQFGTRHYPYFENGRAKQYSFRKLPDQTLKTGLGDIETAVFERVRPKGSNRSTKIWLAKDWGYLIARIEQQENGDSQYALELESATIGKQSLNTFNTGQDDEEEGDFGFGAD